MPHLSTTRRIDLAVGVLVRDHLAAAGEVDRRAVEPPVVVLQLFAVAAERDGAPGASIAREVVDAAAEAARSASGGRRSSSM